MSREYEFTLVLTGISELSDEVMDAFFKAGCDDATFSLRLGRVFATFERKADSLKEAVLSAISDIRCACVGADVLRVDACNLVTQADIARKIGRSRQHVHQYVTGERGPKGFPPPVCDLAEGAPVWHWCDVADWLWRNGIVDESVAREAIEISAINDVLDWGNLKQRNPGLADEILQSISSDCCS